MCSGVARGMLDFPQPRRAIGGVMDDQILAGVFSSDGLFVACIHVRPRAHGIAIVSESEK